MPAEPEPRTALLSIAGSDPSGGAGIQADLKTCTALGVYGAAAITCLTVQNTLGVRYFQPLAPQLVYDQIRAVLEDLPVSHVKIGMVGSAALAAAVAAALEDFTGEVIYDPVLRAGDGQRLMAAGELAGLAGALLPKVTVLTPNLPELACLSVAPPTAPDPDEEQLLRRADILLARFPNLRAVVITGGHRDQEESIVRDLLVLRPNQPERVVESRHPRLPSANLHGTGCTFATALAAWHLRGASYPEAFRRAAVFTLAAIRAGAGLTMGGGNGPLGHHLLVRPQEV
ncbi:bifunctional hydroxymethylpyrimidine kinase/phosphomethylpyrimidine kinase [Desulfurivibrio sp. D14AmB]|uniref:bifunctional hydroxymethylpyrimidine kinase/phosphomethylpyrimidine kinase n=1 Tax=Desulfurivibrio sp. D14AmB TaxID=3374370 RepID=UPI00376F2993